MDYILAHQDEFAKPTDIKIALTLLGEGMYDLSDRVALRDFLRAEALKFRRPLRQVSSLPKVRRTRDRSVRLGVFQWRIHI